MKYFLPQLYAQLQSSDPDLADAAERALEDASDAYNRRWEEIKSQLPPQVVRFSEEQNLHDADVFAPARVGAPIPGWGRGDVVIVAQQVSTLYAETVNTLAFMRYVPAGEPAVEIPLHSPAFSRTQPDWQYDEFDVVEPGVFSHRILLSDGRVITILFREFDYYLAPLLAPGVLKTLGAASPKRLSPA
jgi:hypothetical protein